MNLKNRIKICILFAARYNLTVKIQIKYLIIFHYRHSHLPGFINPEGIFAENFYSFTLSESSFY